MPFFDIFASPRWSLLRMRTKVVSFFIVFRELSNKKIKALRPKMTKIASRGGGVLPLINSSLSCKLRITGVQMWLEKCAICESKKLWTTSCSVLNLKCKIHKERLRGMSKTWSWKSRRQSVIKREPLKCCEKITSNDTKLPPERQEKEKKRKPKGYETHGQARSSTCVKISFQLYFLKVPLDKLVQFSSKSVPTVKALGDRCNPCRIFSKPACTSLLKNFQVYLGLAPRHPSPFRRWGYHCCWHLY